VALPQPVLPSARPPLTIRPFEERDRDPVLALLREVLGARRAFERSAAFFAWKHEVNPFGRSVLLVAEDGAPVGLRAFLRWRFRFGAQVVQAGRAVDTATHPAHRRQGIFSTLTRRALDQARGEGIDLIFNTPNRSSLPGYLKLGWTRVGRIHPLVRLVHPERVLRALARPASGEDPPEALSLPAPPAQTLLEEGEVVDRLLREDDRQRASWIRTDRSLAFLRWRYGQAPSPPYHAERSPDRSAAVIFRGGRRRGLREGLCAEVLLGAGGSRQLAGVMRRVAAVTAADYLVACAPRGSAHWWALLRCGFLPVPAVGPHLTVRPLSPRVAAVPVLEAARWHLSLGDLELF
jgi:GNAT superfamily N-acetyltransferase